MLAGSFADLVLATATLISALTAAFLAWNTRLHLKTGNGKTIGETVTEIKDAVNTKGDGAGG
jgi:hypothetical protein